MNNPILDPSNHFFPANAPSDLLQLRKTLDGVPLGVTASGELGVKVIVIGNASVGLGDLPTADPHVKGKVWNNNGNPVVSQG